MTTVKLTVDAIQGKDAEDKKFGYVGSEIGGYFFTYMNGKDTTVDSLIGTLDVDAIDAPDFAKTQAAAALRQWDAAGRPRHFIS